ncbi:MAG: DUF1937 family protein [Planctomycetia bacterium]|nr:DUF1937 family protein [Planctomycetia bacterium]
MIYLASPYSHRDAGVRQERFEAACRTAAVLIRQGKTVFSPIAHSHAICRHGVPLDWRFWQRHDRRYLDVCDEVVVLMLDGWRESVGVQAEIAIARGRGFGVEQGITQERQRLTLPARKITMAYRYKERSGRLT